jgi:hypothetical protein
MPKYQCRCGTVMDLVESPAPFEYALISERSIEDAGDFVEIKNPSREGLFSILGKGSRKTYRCPHCGRLHIQKAEGSSDFDVFNRELG